MWCFIYHIFIVANPRSKFDFLNKQYDDTMLSEKWCDMMGVQRTSTTQVEYWKCCSATSVGCCYLTGAASSMYSELRL